MGPYSFFLVIFVLATVVHLYASFRWNKKLRNCTKPLIVLSLLLYYVFTSEHPELTLVLALAFSWAGDIFLIFKKLRFFVCGGVAFIASHVFFILSFLPYIHFATLPLWVVFTFGATYILAAVCVVRQLGTDIHKPLHLPVYAYLLINAISNCFAFFMLLSTPCVGSAVVFVGTVFFFVSDSVLFHVRFKQSTHWKSHVPVMLTYALAELYITLGMMML